MDSLDEFIPYIRSFGEYTELNELPLIYFRFADHESLLPREVKAKIIHLNPEEGFELFIDNIFKTIEKYGYGACYVFDSLSELAVDWYSDRMVANFFMLTCPYLFDFKTVTYFVLFRDRHSEYTISKIHNTSQVVLDVYDREERHYIHPLKVWNRHSPTMYMLHMWNEDRFKPIRLSAQISEILARDERPWIDLSTKLQNIRSRTFSQASRLLQEFKLGLSKYYELEPIKEKIIRMALTRDPQLFEKAKRYFSLKDLIAIGRRMIGTGLIGGKSVGMLLAQAILKNSDKKWNEKLEHNDSFFIGSDVFYTYLVLNKAWWLRYKIKSSENFLELASEAREILKKGEFPQDIIEQLRYILNYYGQSPIIVRSSSLLEDAYGNAFSGKYKSVFLANQGPPEERLKAFLDAIKTVYVSTMSEEALMYRKNRNLLDQDEQMAILVQRVSGAPYGDLFYPQLAGVGYSYNPFLWNKEIDPKAGLIRLVFGLGTRAVDRHDDDYTRIIALNMPERRPEANKEDKQKWNQRKVDVLNLRENSFKSIYFDEIASKSSNLQVELFGSRDFESEQMLKQRGRDRVIYTLDLDKIIAQSSIVKDMKEILKILENEYEYPVDIEFTINFTDQQDYKIYVLQCRPLQVKSESEKIETLPEICEEKIIFKTQGPIVGNGLSKRIDKLIYVVPEEYSKLSMQDRYGIARLIGKLNALFGTSGDETIFLAGPGRWATSSPSLGVPVSFHEINGVKIICEIAEMHEALNPDVSLGTHFFNDLVESDMLYIALNPREKNSIFNREILKKMENTISKYITEAIKYQDIVKVYKSPNGSGKEALRLYADPIHQIAILYQQEDM